MKEKSRQQMENDGKRNKKKMQENGKEKKIGIYTYSNMCEKD